MARAAGLEPATFGSVDRRSDPTELRAQRAGSIPENGDRGELDVRRLVGARRATGETKPRGSGATSRSAQARQLAASTWRSSMTGVISALSEGKRLAEKPGFEPGKELKTP